MNERLFKRMVIFLMAGLFLRLIVVGIFEFFIPLIELPLYSSIVMCFTGLIMFLAYFTIGKSANIGKSIFFPSSYLDTLSVVSSSVALAGLIAAPFSLFYFAFSVSLYSMRFGFMFLAAYMVIAAAMLIDFIFFRLLLALSLTNLVSLHMSRKVIYSTAVIYYLFPVFYAVILGFNLDNYILGAMISEVLLITLLSVFYLIVWKKRKELE